MRQGTRRQRQPEARREALEIIREAKSLRGSTRSALTDQFCDRGFTGDRIDLMRALRKLHSEGLVRCSHFTGLIGGDYMRVHTVDHLRKLPVTAGATA